MTIKSIWTRVIQRCLVAVASLAVIVCGSASWAIEPVVPAYFEPDYEASGMVVPAGAPAPQAYNRAVQQAAFFGGGTPGPMPAGYCDQPAGVEGCCAGYCDGTGCACGCGPGGCGCHGGLFGHGLLGRGQQGFAERLFYGGPYRAWLTGSTVGALRALLPYRDAGLAAQRWFDLSVDVMYLETSGGTSDLPIATLGQGPGNPVLLASDADDSRHMPGGRITGAFIVGPGDNIEVTYLGGQRWRGGASAEGNGNLFSILSNYGDDPNGGFGQTDNSNVQSVSSEATFHSGEVNYRRRTVGPFGRFQGSLLGGIRYFRFDNTYGYFAEGPNGSFDMRNAAQNEMVGAQFGGDLWWNVVPGINVGAAAKGGPMGNRITRNTSIGADPTFAPNQLSDHRSTTTWIAELELMGVYRLSHSWAIKGSAFLINADRVGYGFDLGPTEQLADIVVDAGAIPTRSLTIRGYTLGAEYVW